MLNDTHHAKRAQGLLAQRLRAGAKGLTTTVVNGAILRAMRRGRISKATARRCLHDWDKHLVRRPQRLKWQHYATARLNEAARLRRAGQFHWARYALTDVRHALAQ